MKRYFDDEEPETDWISPEFLYEAGACKFCGGDHTFDDCKIVPTSHFTTLPGGRKKKQTT